MGDANAVDSEGRSAMHSAAAEGHGSVVKALMDRGAKAKADSHGHDVMWWAKSKGHAEVIAILSGEVFQQRKRETISADAAQGTVPAGLGQGGMQIPGGLPGM